MKRTIGIALATAGLCAALSTAASAQNAKDIVGAWETISITSERADGSKFSPITGRLKGLVIFTSDGHFSQHNVNLDMPKIAANNRQQGTADENKAIMQGSYALFGRYTVDETDHTLAIQIEGSSFPNEIGKSQKRPFTLSGEQLTFVNPAPPSGGKGAVNVLKRAK